jgi:hypothetical protein
MLGSGEDHKVCHAQRSCDSDEISQTVVFTFLNVELVMEERGKKNNIRKVLVGYVLSWLWREGGGGFPTAIKRLKGGRTLSLVAVLGSMRRRISLTRPMTE